MEKFIRKIIREQIEKIFESIEMSNEKKNYTPTDAVSNVASNAISALEALGRRGQFVQSIDGSKNEGSGSIKAKQLSQKKQQSFIEMKRLKSFFEKNFKKVEEERKNLGIVQQKRGTEEEMLKSNIIMVWNLHGGDACKKWVDEKLSDTHKQGNKTKERLRKLGGANKNNGMGVFNFNYDPSQKRINK